MMNGLEIFLHVLVLLCCYIRTSKRCELPALNVIPPESFPLVGRSVTQDKSSSHIFSSFSFYGSFLNDDDDDGSLRKFGNRCARALFLCPFWARWRGETSTNPPSISLLLGQKTQTTPLLGHALFDVLYKLYDGCLSDGKSGQYSCLNV